MMRAYHDLGGLPGGPIDREERETALWERQVHAMVLLLAERKLVSVDELRAAIETLGETEYRSRSYYERWTEALARVMVAKGILTTAELTDRMEAESP